MIESHGYAAQSATDALKPFTFQRRDPGPKDVVINILFCGICHSDIHQAADEWGGSRYPMVPGHEIIGVVQSVGNEVTQFKVGDHVGVGCMVDSCRDCQQCNEDFEQFCDHVVYTYNSEDPQAKPQPTFGGYSSSIVVNEHFVLKVPENLDLAACAPLLCAGITTYSPLKNWGVKPGDKVGVVGLGGLGHMAVKIAKAMGAHVVVFTHSPNKVEDAKRLGADDVVISSDESQMIRHANTIHVIINTVSVPHDLDPYLATLDRDGTMVFVGVPSEKHPAPNIGSLIRRRRSMAGSLIGGIKETQEMLDFCGKHNIVSEIEKISIQDVNAAYKRVLKSDVKYRFVIDMSSLK